MSYKCADNSISKLQNDALNIYGKYDLEKSLIWMTEEYGEVIQAVRKQKMSTEITEELGDLLAWVFCIANILDISIEDSINASFSKEIMRQINTYGKMKYCSDGYTLNIAKTI